MEKEKTRAELLEEVTSLRQQLAEIERTAGHGEPRFYRRVVDSMPIGVNVYKLEVPDDAGSLRMIGVNRAANEMTSVSMERFVGKTLRECMPAALETEAPQACVRAVRTDQVQILPNFEYGDKNIPGSGRTFSVSAVPLGDKRVVVLFENITERKTAGQALRLRSLTKRLRAVREEERTMMAREIHDQLGQALTSLKIDLSWLLDKLPKNQKAARGRASSMISVVDTTLESVHDLSSRLRPAILDDLGLEAAIEWQAQEFTSRTGCNCKLDLRTGDLGLSHDRDTTVFRILQEALTNVARHAEASRVEISLQTPPRPACVRSER